ncbi:MAG: hypothetical protein ABIN91_02525 [Mucilaginibacter sp.]|uniref:hypothetical protein n=1 Tax=Mucilaginibacter sp. TaxID=1882438 RepID=UPI003262FC21
MNFYIDSYSELFVETVTDSYNNQTRSVREERKELIQQINDLNTRTDKARDLLLLDELEAGEFRKIKEENNEKVTRLEAKLNEVLVQNSTLLDIKPIAESAIKCLEILDKLWDDANIQGQR